MSDVVIRAEHLGKRYLIGHQSAERERYTALRDVIGRSLKGLGQSALDLVRGRQIIAGDEIEEFWALRDVSFEIRRGEVVGIIGRNGAGKSTLLKVLSRITEPTEGRVTIKGRVASLLEVGTGFHPELTGRENIYLNGAILGMTRAEIKRKFDEIVAFAEVEKFLDTPVKRYSSGMYVRLAFAVAAHLEPEILVVDEVLAVGDADFQKKCLGKMGEVAKAGRTVLFVSHNTGSVSTICEKGMLLRAGNLIADGPMSEVLSQYRGLKQSDVTAMPHLQFRGPLRGVRITSIEINGHPTAELRVVSSDDDISIGVRGRADEDIANLRFSVALFHRGLRIVTCHDGPENLPVGEFEFRCTFPARSFRPGEYTLAAGARRVAGDEWVWGTDLCSLEIIPVWGAEYDSDDIGIVNLPRRLVRSKRYAPVGNDQAGR
ncbi:MAG: ABC transporter ATP-binding protein [Hyphomicrobium sp.]|nr:ABC transporter ATP-binding protein [Hyphomicrobium sp.]